MQTEENYQYFMKTDMQKYIGEWIAICDQRIVSHGKNPKQVMKEAQEKYPTKRIFLARIPDKETMIF